MQKKFFGFSLAAAVILVAAISGLVRSRVAAQNLGSREFTIIRSEISNTKIPMKLMSFDAQRGDGAQATGDYIIPNGPADIQHLHTRLVVLPSTGERISIDDIAHARTTMYTTPAGRPTSADPTCGFGKIGAAVKPVLKGTEEILGFKTVVTQTDDGPYLTTTWKAPDLDCKVVKMTEDRRDQNGTITGHFELQALQITLGPPHASLNGFGHARECT